MQNDTQFGEVFNDFLMDDLYTKPVFGDCVWSSFTANSTGRFFYHIVTKLEELTGGWYSLESKFLHEEEVILNGKYNICRVVPQPSRFNGIPFEFILTYNMINQTLIWPDNIEWIMPYKEEKLNQGKYNISPLTTPLQIKEFQDNWKTDVYILSGELPAVFPISGKTMTFERKESADPENQLMDLVEYLNQRYQIQGLKTEKNIFSWRNISQTNLIVRFPSTLSLLECNLETPNFPIVFMDHFDTAFCGDIFSQTGSNPTKFIFFFKRKKSLNKRSR